MRISVKLDHAADRYGDRIAAIPAKARQVMAEGLNEGGDLERTQVRRDLKHQTGVKRYGAITQRTSTKRASAGNLEYTIAGTGKGMPIREFPVSAAPHAPVNARPWGVAHKFARSFMTSAKGLLRARLGAARMPIRALFGPSVAKEIVKDETAAHFEAQAAPRVERAVMKRLGRLLP